MNRKLTITDKLRIATVACLLASIGLSLLVGADAGLGAFLAAAVVFLLSEITWMSE